MVQNPSEATTDRLGAYRTLRSLRGVETWGGFCARLPGNGAQNPAILAAPREDSWVLCHLGDPSSQIGRFCTTAPQGHWGSVPGLVVEKRMIAGGTGVPEAATTGTWYRTLPNPHGAPQSRTEPRAHCYDLQGARGSVSGGLAALYRTRSSLRALARFVGFCAAWGDALPGPGGSVPSARNEARFLCQVEVANQQEMPGRGLTSNSAGRDVWYRTRPNPHQDLLSRTEPRVRCGPS